MYIVKESCAKDGDANDGEHTENNGQYQECKLSLEQVLVSFCMVFPLVLGEFLQKTMPNDLTLSVMHFPSSREVASWFS